MNKFLYRLYPVIMDTADNVNNATTEGLNSAKKVWKGTIVPYLEVALVIFLIILIVLSVIDNKNGDTPVKKIISAVLVFIAMAVVAASYAWL